MFKVYHTKDFMLNSLLHFDVDGYVPDKDDYKEVAVVDCNELGNVFELTNHIDHAWTENPECKVLSEKCRSTSVGDLVYDRKNKLYMCDSIGWEEVEWMSDESADSLRSAWRFWKRLYNKFNDTNAKSKMDKVLSLL